MDDDVKRVALKAKELMDNLNSFDENDSALAITHSAELIRTFDQMIDAEDTIDKRCYMLKRAKSCLNNMEDIFISGITNNDENKLTFITYYSNIQRIISQMEVWSNE